MADEQRVYEYKEPPRHRPPGQLATAASLLIGLVMVISALDFVVSLTVPQAELSVLVVGAVAEVPAAVVFILWLWRVRSNAELIPGAPRQRMRKGWAIAGWFLPGVGYYVLYRYLQDIWQASSPDRSDIDSPVLFGWFMAYWLTLLPARLVVRYGLVIPQINLVIDGLLLVAGVLILLIVRRITAWQTVAA
jgi:hypothetical protein